MLFLLAAPLSHTVNEAVSDLSNPDVYNKDTGSSFSRVSQTEAYKQAALPFAGDTRAEQVSHQIDVLSERCVLVNRSRMWDPACSCCAEGDDVRQMLVTSTGRGGTDFLTMLLRELGFLVQHDDRHISADQSPDGAVSWPANFNSIRPAGTEVGGEDCTQGWQWRRARRLEEPRPPLQASYDHQDAHQVWRKYDSRRFLHVFGMVREPLANIASRWSLGGWSNKHSKVSCLTVSDDAPRTERQRAWPKRDFSLFETMQYYVLWHTFAESYVEWSFRLEDAQHKVVELLVRAGFAVERLPTAEAVKRSLEKIGNHANHNHTHHSRNPSDAVTWRRLEKLDRDWAYMLWQLAMRHNYTYAVDEAPSFAAEAAGTGASRTVCGIRRADQRWACTLKSAKKRMSDQQKMIPPGWASGP